MIIAPLLALSLALTTARACPVGAAGALPELPGTWRVVLVSGLDHPRPDSVVAEAAITPDLQGCLLREQLRARTGNPAYEAIILWGANGPDSTIERVFAHSRHGRVGFYQGRRRGDSIPLRQLSTTGPANEVVENLVDIRDRNRFTITSRLSSDGGRTWQLLSRWEYQRTTERSGL